MSLKCVQANSSTKDDSNEGTAENEYEHGDGKNDIH